MRYKLNGVPVSIPREPMCWAHTKYKVLNKG